MDHRPWLVGRCNWEVAPSKLMERRWEDRIDECESVMLEALQDRLEASDDLMMDHFVW